MVINFDNWISLREQMVEIYVEYYPVAILAIAILVILVAFCWRSLRKKWLEWRRFLSELS